MTRVPSSEIIKNTECYGAKNYQSLPVVIVQAEGVWVEDPEGHRYIDMLSAYSALNQGHRHPRIIEALRSQADKVTLTSRAFYSEQLGLFYERLTRLTSKRRVLPMNSGTEAVETAIKAARRWGCRVKGITSEASEIIVCNDNFHGRTVTAISMSSNDEYKEGFGPLTPGFRLVPFGDVDALKQAISTNTAAFLVEPIQGEAGIRIPPDGYLKAAYEVCQAAGVLFMADEIQTGFGRTGRRFACDWEGVVPDVYVLGKALGGGVIPVSAVVANEDVMDVFEPGSHGSTFGGNPLACAVANAAMDVIEDERLADRSLELGDRFLADLKTVRNRHIVDVRGRGLFIGVELDISARPYCERLMEQGVLCKETHDTVIRFAPPLIISDDDLAEATRRIREVLEQPVP